MPTWSLPEKTTIKKPSFIRITSGIFSVLYWSFPFIFFGDVEVPVDAAEMLMLASSLVINWSCRISSISVELNVILTSHN